MIKSKIQTGGNHSRTRRVLCLFLSMVMLVTVFSSFSMQTSANAAMSSITVQWANPQQLRKINKTQKEAVLTANINGTATNIYVSFPTEGGVRVRTDNKGNFEPKSLKNIKYYSMTDGSMLMDAGDVAVKLHYSSYPWKMEFLNSDAKVAHTISARQMYFGYKNGELRKVKLEGPVTDNEMLYGLGGRYNDVNQIGQRVQLWNLDCWSEDTKAYVNVPILNSTNGYSVFFSSYYGGYADVGYTNEEVWSFEFNGIDFDYFVYTETPAENTVAYTNLTGKPFVAPKWSFGYWAGQTGSYWTSGDKTDDYANYKKLVTEALTKYKEMGTMPSAIYLEGTIVDNKDVLKIADKFGVKTLGWQPPHSIRGNGSTTIEGLKTLLPDVDEWDLPTPHNYENTEVVLNTWGDYSNPLMQTAHEIGAYNELLAAGLSGSMIDYGEYIEEGYSFYNGMKGDEMHNYNAYVFTDTFNRIFSKVRGEDFVLFARAGCAGTQKFAGNFGGDQQSTFVGLRKAYINGISLNASGFSNWGSDIGGLSGDPTNQLYLRWLQLGTFSPFMRTHGGSSRDPWSFGTIGTNTFKQLYWLRTALVDYIYGANLETGITGIPMMQTMAYAFPEQKELALVEDQYMFGTELLVCPVLDENTTYLNITFPEGKWTDLFDGKTYEGGTQLIGTPINVIPVYLRDGAVIKTKVSKNFSMTDSMSDKSYEAVIAAPASKEHKSVFRADKKTTYSFTNKPNGENGFTVSNDSKHTAKLLIAAGTTASSVKVNGKTLKKLSNLPANDSVVGYYVDYENRRTLVFTGGNWNTVSVVDSNMGYKNLALDATVSSKDEIIASQAESIIDNDPTSVWMIHSTEDGVATVDLGSEQTVNRLVLTWSAYSPESYKLEVSANGSNWKNINNSAAIGGAETYRLAGEKVRYVRITEVVKSEDQLASPAITELEVFGNELVDETIVEDEFEIPDNSYEEEEEEIEAEEEENEPEEEVVEEVVKKRRKVKVAGSGGLPTIAIVLIIVGSVLVLAAAAVIVIIVLKKKKQAKQSG